MGHSAETKAKIRATLMGHSVSDETRILMSEIAREHAQINFEGGVTGIEFARVLCPAGYIREHYLYYGDHVVRFGITGQLRRRFFRLDFAHLEAKVNIEIDGTKHSSPLEIERDRRRDSIIRDLGWKIIRIKERYGP
jgi:hypothetical protein